MLQVSTDIFNIQQTVAITSAVRELVLQRPCLPGLCRKPLADFVEDFLARCVFQQWFSSRKERRALDLPDRALARTEFVPVISYISPSLGRLVSPLKVTRPSLGAPAQPPAPSSCPSLLPCSCPSFLQVLTRQELVPSGRSPRNTPRAAKRKLHEQEGGGREGRKSAARLPRMELDQRLDSLKVGLDQDSKKDRQFEARLEAALLQ